MKLSEEEIKVLSDPIWKNDEEREWAMEVLLQKRNMKMSICIPFLLILCLLGVAITFHICKYYF